MLAKMIPAKMKAPLRQHGKCLTWNTSTMLRNIKRKQTKALHALNSQVSDDELSRNDISFREHPLSADPNITNLRRQNRRIYLQMWGPASI